jgi:hypothetical protein
LTSYRTAPHRHPPVIAKRKTPLTVPDHTYEKS